MQIMSVIYSWKKSDIENNFQIIDIHNWFINILINNHKIHESFYVKCN